MNSVCELGCININEGPVCRQCRVKFKNFSTNDYEFHQCVNCCSCDKYGFPCNECAKYAFEFSLGSGSNSSNPITTEQLLDLLDGKTVIIETDIEMDSEMDNNKNYCMIM